MQQEVAAVKYVPSPHAFMADTRDVAAVDAKRRELRPYYIALYDTIRR